MDNISTSLSLYIYIDLYASYNDAHIMLQVHCTCEMKAVLQEA